MSEQSNVAKKVSLVKEKLGISGAKITEIVGCDRRVVSWLASNNRQLPYDKVSKIESLCNDLLEVAEKHEISP